MSVFSVLSFLVSILQIQCRWLRFYRSSFPALLWLCQGSWVNSQVNPHSLNRDLDCDSGTSTLYCVAWLFFPPLRLLFWAVLQDSTCVVYPPLLILPSALTGTCSKRKHLSDSAPTMLHFRDKATNQSIRASSSHMAAPVEIYAYPIKRDDMSHCV